MSDYDDSDGDGTDDEGGAGARIWTQGPFRPSQGHTLGGAANDAGDAGDGAAPPRAAPLSGADRRVRPKRTRTRTRTTLTPSRVIFYWFAAGTARAWRDLPVAAVQDHDGGPTLLAS